MATRDPDSKRRQLIEAGLAEFSANGIAGARIERIAKAANCSAGLVYTYFGSKEELFQAVFEFIVATVLDEAPITPDDLPEYAGRLFDGYETHPEVARFMAWYQLEGGSQPNPAVLAATRTKIAAIEDAQRRGTVPAGVVPAELLALILQISGIWNASTPEFDQLLGEYSRDDRRRAVVGAIAALVRD